MGTNQVRMDRARNRTADARTEAKETGRFIRSIG
jgi:hypothetical protein